MMKSRLLVGALLLCRLGSMTSAESMFFDAMSGTGSNPANWSDPSTWFDYNGSGLGFGRVPTADDYAFLLDGYNWGGDPMVDTATVNSNGTAKALYVGYWGCAASMAFEPGDYTLAIVNQANIGYNGNAVINQNGGTFTAASIRMGYDTSVTTYNMNAGQLTSQPWGGFVVGAGSSGMADGSSTTFNQTGGTVTTTGFAVGKAGTTGIYNMTGGTLNGFDYGGGDFQIGAVGNRTQGSIQSEFNLGNAVSTGTIQMDGDSSLIIDHRNSMLRGWGTFEMGGAGSSAARLYNDGVVKADGYGIDRDLDLSQFHDVQIYDDENLNTGTNGWYAVNKGRLLLPSIAVAAGNHSYNWGEDNYFESTSLVNSLRVNFTGAVAGDLVVALLAEDRSDVAAHDGLAFLALWNIDELAFANANLIFRYDDAKAAALGIDQSELNIFKLVGNTWVLLPGSVDLLSKQISGSTDSFGMFAVGAVVPEPATLVLLGIGAALLRKRSR